MLDSKKRKKQDKFFEELDHWIDHELKDYQLDEPDEFVDEYRWKDT